MKESILFLKNFVTKPATTGAIVPSSKFLADEIVRQAGVAQANLVLEFGAGTGSFTEKIIKIKKDDAHFVAVERNAELVGILKGKFPDENIVWDSIENIEEVLNRLGIQGKADCIVCGLPWASFNEKLQKRLLDTTHDILKDGGVFTTFAYLQGLLLPAGQKFKKNINERFSKVEKSTVVWRNLPPAFVYRCVKG
jgi:phospholipid N-methyltransferase